MSLGLSSGVTDHRPSSSTGAEQSVDIVGWFEKYLVLGNNTSVL